MLAGWAVARATRAPCIFSFPLCPFGSAGIVGALQLAFADRSSKAPRNGVGVEEKEDADKKGKGLTDEFKDGGSFCDFSEWQDREQGPSPKP